MSIIQAIRFQSTPSVWRETWVSAGKCEIKQFQSTPSVWRETAPTLYKAIKMAISIHSLRVEGDSARRTPAQNRTQFQSTPSVWRETTKAIIRCKNCGISIHSLRVEGDGHAHARKHGHFISIHSLRVEGDVDNSGVLIPSQNFNPLPPCGGRRLSAVERRFYEKFQSTPSVWRETTGRSRCYCR